MGQGPSLATSRLDSPPLRSGAVLWPLVAGGVPGDEGRSVVPHHGAPARAVASAGSAGVPAQTGDVGPGVAAVGEDGDPVAAAGLAPHFEAGRVERAGEEAAAVEHEAHRARAVVSTRGERAVSPSPYIREVVNLVR